MKTSHRIAATLGLCLVVGMLSMFASPADAHVAAHGFNMMADPLWLMSAAPMFLGNTVSADELKKLEEALIHKSGEVVEKVSKALKDEVDKFSTITGKTNEKLTEVATEASQAVKAVAEFKARMTEIEQKLAARPGPGGQQAKSAGQVFAESEELKAALKSGSPNVSSVTIGAIHQKTAIVNATGQNQPLVADQRLDGVILPTANRRLTIRDLLPQMRTTSNLVQFAKESVFTNNAGLQFNSPNDVENVSKNESAITFTLSNAAVSTIAHFIPASRQILADAPALQGYIDGRLLYGLKLVEETQMLTGDGTAGNLSGLLTNATAYNRGVSNDTMIDCLLKAMLQVALSEFASTGFVLNPIDWTQIMLLKDTQGRYIFSNPQEMSQPRMWGQPVVPTNSMTSGQFLTAAFDLAAAIWDREDANIRVSEHHASFFIQNMVAILCEERMALAIYRPLAFVKGTLPALGT